MRFLQVRSNPPKFISFVAAICTAGLLFAAMPGEFSLWPLLFVAFVPILVIIPRLSPRRAACMGLFCGLLYNIFLLHWIVIVLGQYGGFSSLLAVAGMAALAFYMACYFSFFCFLLAGVMHKRSNSQIAFSWICLLAPLFWTGLEHARGLVLTGFPWMDLGYGLYKQPLLMQIADLGGHYLVSFAVMLVNALLAVWANKILLTPAEQQRKCRAPVAIGIVVLIAFFLYSMLRYQQIQKEIIQADQAVVSVIQGNIRQDEKWSPQKKEATVGSYLALSKKAVENNETDLIIWPETALPFFPSQDILMGRVVDFIHFYNVPLLTGAPFFEFSTRSALAKQEVITFNSALLINSEARLAGRYNKQHLVPFGEYVPFRRFLPFLEPLVVAVGDFTAGKSFSPLVTGKIRAGVLICFESIFPDIARREILEGSNLLINMTNDAWYGRTSAPFQSFAMAVFRAVENRRTLVRAANTGISGFVDPAGKIRVRSPLFQTASLSSPVVLLDGITIFDRWGYLFAPCCLLFILPVFLFARRK